MTIKPSWNIKQRKQRKFCVLSERRLHVQCVAAVLRESCSWGSVGTRSWEIVLGVKRHRSLTSVLDLELNKRFWLHYRKILWDQPGYRHSRMLKASIIAEDTGNSMKQNWVIQLQVSYINKDCLKQGLGLGLGYLVLACHQYKQGFSCSQLSDHQGHSWMNKRSSSVKADTAVCDRWCPLTHSTSAGVLLCCSGALMR